MKSEFIMINDCIFQRDEITWVKVEGDKVDIMMNNGNSITNVTETEESARELFQAIWNLLN